jgi:hypothetical protein
MTSHTGRGGQQREEEVQFRPIDQHRVHQEHMLRLHSSSWRRASSVGFPMNRTKPTADHEVDVVAADPGRARKQRAANRVTVDLPAPGIPDTITHPDTSPLVTRAIVPIMPPGAIGLPPPGEPPSLRPAGLTDITVNLRPAPAVS